MAKILLALILVAALAGKGSADTISIQPSSSTVGVIDVTPTTPLTGVRTGGTDDATTLIISETATINSDSIAAVDPTNSDSIAAVDPTETINDQVDSVKAVCNLCDVDKVVNAPTVEEKCEKIPAFTDCVNEKCDQENLHGQLKLATKECRADDDVLKKWAASALIEVECKTTGSSNCSEEANEVVNALSNGITKACTKVKAFTTCQDNNCEKTYLYTDIKEAFKEKCGSSIIQVSALALVLSLLLRFL